MTVRVVSRSPRGALRATLLGLVGLACFAPPPAFAAKRDQAFRLGDGRVTVAGPRVGFAYACERPTGGQAAAGAPWIERRSWRPSRRPVVDGKVLWDQARFAIDGEGRTSSFAGNGFPAGTATGVFPPAAGDDARAYAPDYGALAGHELRGSYTNAPRTARRAGCLDPGTVVAIAADGAPILTPMDATGVDLAAREVTDRCGGRTDGAGLYRYRQASPCLGRRATGREHSGLVGWARDGFPLFGPRGARGVPLRSADLDACHGHVHRISAGGVKRRLYHYHATPDFPYTIGCFRGRPAAEWSVRKLPVEPAPQPEPVPQPEPKPESNPEPKPDPPPTGPAPTPISDADVGTDPALFPAWDPDVSDYVVRCEQAPAVDVDVDAPAGLEVEVDGGPPLNGSFTVPVGLEPDERFSFAVSNEAERRTFHVRCLPDDFPQFTAERLGSPQAEWYVTTPSVQRGTYAAVFDTNGVPLWWYTMFPVPADARLTDRGTLMWARANGLSFGRTSANSGYEEHALDGSLLSVYQTVDVPTDFHDMEELKNGNRLLLGYKPRDGVDLSAYGGPSNATVLDAEVQEIDDRGRLVWSWNSKDHIAVSEAERLMPSIIAAPNGTEDGRTAYDIVHINSVEEDGDGIIVSMRNTDAVYRVKRATGAIDWKLGGTPTPERLTIVGDGLGTERFGGQHDARRLDDGTVTLHDNGTARNRPAAALRYRIDTLTRTATLLEQVTDPDPGFSFCCGNARKLPGGNWVAAWGASPFISELTPTGEKAFRLKFEQGSFPYRAVAVPPGELAREDLRTGMDKMHPR